MKFAINTRYLADQLTKINRVASKQDSSFIKSLRNMLVEADKSGRVTLTGTNLELTVICSFPAEVTQAGRTTIPAATFTNYIKRIPDDTVEVSLVAKDKAKAPHQIKITWGKDNEAYIKKDSSEDDFPIIPTIKTEAKNCLYSQLDKQSLSRALACTLFAADHTQERLILAGGYLHCLDGQIFLVATDSYRLSEHLVGETKKPKTPPVIIPTKTLDYLQSVLDEHGDQISIYTESQQVLFELKDMKITSRLIDGNYPEYRPLLPAADKFQTIVEVDRVEFLKYIRLAGELCEKEGSRVVVLSCQPGSGSAAGQLGINPADSQIGTSSATIKAKITGEEITVNFNHRYLREALERFGIPEADEDRGVGLSTVYMGISGKLEPCVLYDDSPASPQATVFRHAIMPIRS